MSSHTSAAPAETAAGSAEAARERKEEEEFAALDELEFLSALGLDSRGDAVVRILAKAIPAKAASADLLRRYTIHFTQELLRNSPVGQGFSILYFHSGFLWDQNCPGVLTLQWLYHELPEEFRERVTAVYAVHPGFRLRTGLFLLSPWLSNKLYSKVIFISRLEFLEGHLELTESDIPAYILEHDKALEEHPLMDYGFQIDKLALKAQVPDIVDTSEQPT